MHTAQVYTCKGKTIPLRAWTGTQCYSRLGLPEFLDLRHMKVVRSASAAPPPQERDLIRISVRGLADHRAHWATGKMKSVTSSGIEPATFRFVA